jgi:hypothetical protein
LKRLAKASVAVAEAGRIVIGGVFLQGMSFDTDGELCLMGSPFVLKLMDAQLCLRERDTGLVAFIFPVDVLTDSVFSFIVIDHVPRVINLKPVQVHGHCLGRNSRLLEEQSVSAVTAVVRSEVTCNKRKGEMGNCVADFAVKSHRKTLQY